MRSNVHRRLEDLEGRVMERQGTSEISSEARERRRKMKESLDRLAAWRRGELSEEQAAEVEAEHAAIKTRMAQRWGEGRT